MTKHEKNDHAAVRQDRNLPTNTAEEEPLDELEDAEELLKTSFTAGKEMKIAVAVIGVLVLIFAAVMVRWLRRSPEPAPAPGAEAVATNDRPVAANSDKEEPHRPKASPFGPSGSAAKPTVVPAVPGPGSELKPKLGVQGPDTWSFASDAKSTASKPDHRLPTSSFQPRIASRDASVPASRPKTSDEPKPSFGGWQQDLGDRSRPASPPPTDPFQNRPASKTPRDSTPSAPMAAPLASPASRPSDVKVPQSADTGRWGQNLTLPSERSSAGRPEEPKWGMPPGGLATPSASPQTSPGASSGLNPLRSAAPAGAATSPPPSPSVSTRPSQPSSNALGPPPATNLSASPLAPGLSSSRGQGRRTYVVQNGDTLYDIARQQLGKASRWREIYDLNKELINSRWLDLEPGTQLLLPDAGPENLTERPGVGTLR